MFPAIAVALRVALAAGMRGVGTMRINSTEFRQAIDKLVRKGGQLDQSAAQERFAQAMALTWTARDAAKDVNAAIPRYLSDPVPFTKNAATFRPARKTLLESWVVIKPIQAKYLRFQIYGGTRVPKKRALLVPSGVPLNQYGNIPRNTVKRLLARKGVFSGSVRGVGGIWQRDKKGGLKLLIAYEPKAAYKRRFPFERIVRTSVDRTFAHNLARARQLAKATAK